LVIPAFDRDQRHQAEADRGHPHPIDANLGPANFLQDNTHA